MAYAASARSAATTASKSLAATAEGATAITSAAVKLPDTVPPPAGTLAGRAHDSGEECQATPEPSLAVLAPPPWIGESHVNAKHLGHDQLGPIAPKNARREGPSYSAFRRGRHKGLSAMTPDGARRRHRSARTGGGRALRPSRPSTGPEPSCFSLGVSIISVVVGRAEVMRRFEWASEGESVTAEAVRLRRLQLLLPSMEKESVRSAVNESPWRRAGIRTQKRCARSTWSPRA